MTLSSSLLSRSCEVLLIVVALSLCLGFSFGLFLSTLLQMTMLMSSRRVLVYVLNGGTWIGIENLEELLLHSETIGGQYTWHWILFRLQFSRRRDVDHVCSQCLTTYFTVLWNTAANCTTFSALCPFDRQNAVAPLLPLIHFFLSVSFIWTGMNHICHCNHEPPTYRHVYHFHGKPRRAPDDGQYISSTFSTAGI